MPPVRRSKRTETAAFEPRTLRTRRSAKPESPKPRPRKPTKSYLQRHPGTDPNRNTRLFSLPAELFEDIFDLLCPTAAACLCLTCKEALHRIGTAAWTQFRRSYQVHHGYSDTSLIELLHRDLPHLELCPRCEVLHPELKPPHAHRVTKFTRSCLGQTSTMDYWPQTPDGGYSVVYPHIKSAFETRPDSSDSSAIDLFAGDFTIQQGAVTFQLTSSASWIDRNLILKQQFRLTKSNGTLNALDITSLPLRLCAHLTTSTAQPPEVLLYRCAQSSANGYLLTHAISSAFPAPLQKGVASPKAFRTPSPAEKAQMDSGAGEPGFIWACRACPTKFRVEYHGNRGELAIIIWHCFGREFYKAHEYWKMFARREATNLGKGKRNSEFYVCSRSLPAFRVE